MCKTKALQVGPALVALAFVFIAGALFGVDNENRTHAYKVSRLTGVSYFRIVSPLAILKDARLSSDLDDSPAGIEGEQG